MRKIQIHYMSQDGSRGVINYLTGDNAEVSGASQLKMPALRSQLLARAAHMAGEWSKVFPADRFKVVEV